MNIDGVKRRTAPIQRQTPTHKPIAARPAVRRKTITTRPIGLLSFIDRRQFATIVITFIITFAFSIATSQGLAAVTSHNPISANQSSTTDAALASAQPTMSNLDFAVTEQPKTLELNQYVLTRPDQVYVPSEDANLPDPLKERQEFLKQYLGAKHSPLADHVEALSEQSQWKLIIAISRAESSFCKHEVTNNCWGIGGAWNMKNYKNYDEAVADVNRILEQHYISAGLDTPKEIVKKYVGHQSDTWQAAVEQELQNLASVK